MVWGQLAEFDGVDHCGVLVVEEAVGVGESVVDFEVSGVELEGFVAETDALGVVLELEGAHAPVEIGVFIVGVRVLDVSAVHGGGEGVLLVGEIIVASFL